MNETVRRSAWRRQWDAYLIPAANIQVIPWNFNDFVKPTRFRWVIMGLRTRHITWPPENDEEATSTACMDDVTAAGAAWRNRLWRDRLHASITNETAATERNVITIAVVEDGGLAPAPPASVLPNREGAPFEHTGKSITNDGCMAWRQLTYVSPCSLFNSMSCMNMSVSTDASAGFTGGGGDDPLEKTVWFHSRAIQCQRTSQGNALSVAVTEIRRHTLNTVRQKFVTDWWFTFIVNDVRLISIIVTSRICYNLKWRLSASIMRRV